MDLFLSAQSMSVAAFVAAGCMVAAGAISSGVSRRRARKRQDDLTPSLPQLEPPKLEARRHVAVAGKLHVDGSCCPRLEDALPVAASTYLHHAGAETMAWCARAEALWLEVGDSRIELEGLLLVEVGSEEQYPGTSLEKLRGRVVDRVYNATLSTWPRRKGVPRRGVFRSLRAGDDVLVMGLADRTPEGSAATSYRRAGAGWKLVADEAGPLVVCYRRRPRIRGAFGGLQLWAAAAPL